MGINPDQWSHRILILPVNYQCPWVGLGSQACAPWPCVAWINIQRASWANDLLAHELGERVAQAIPKVDSATFCSLQLLHHLASPCCNTHEHCILGATSGRHLSEDPHGSV
jgi:hypothetical protein